MKLKFLLIIIVLLTFNVFAQIDEQEKITQLNRKVVELYNSGKVTDAVKLAQQSLELSVKVHGADNQLTGLAYANLGVLQREKGNYGESVKNLQKAVDIYQKDVALPITKLIETYQILAYSQFLDGKKTESESNYLKVLNLSATKFGVDSKEVLTPNINLANFYARGRNFEKADVYYLKSYSLAKKNFGDEGKELDQVTDSRECLSDDNKEREKAFKKEFNLIFGYSDLPDGFIINGKALNLVKPPYPEAAKSQRLIAKIKVRVKIDERGNVLSAKAICGASVFNAASESAARASKFSPTLKNSVAVKVSGIIVYNFTAR